MKNKSLLLGMILLLLTAWFATHATSKPAPLLLAECDSEKPDDEKFE